MFALTDNTAHIPGSYRALGLGTTAGSAFTATPGQVAFTPDGRQLLVTTKATGNDVDVFAVRPDGRLSSSPTVNALPGAVPFAVAFGPGGDVVLAEAGTNAVATFSLSPGGALTQLAVGGHRPEGDLLDRAGGRVPLRVQRGQRLA